MNAIKGCKDVFDDKIYQLFRENKNAIDLFFIFLVVVAVYIIFKQVVDFNIIKYDDDLFLQTNAHIQNGFTLDNLIWSTSTYVNANWSPLTLWTYMIDGYLYKNWYGGYHLTNIILHMLNGILLYFVAKKLTKSYFLAAFISLIFVIHPLHVESVAWISQRKDVLSALFMFISILYYQKYLDNASRTTHLVSVLFFICGMLGKVIIAPLPFVLVLMDYVSGRINNKRELLLSLRDKWAFILFAIIIGAINVATQIDSGALKGTSTYSLPLRTENAIINYIAYPLKMFWPINLIPSYKYPDHFALWKVILSGIAFLFISWLAYRKRKEHKLLFLGWYWYVLFITPIVGFLQTGDHSMGDRYTYISIIGPIMAVGIFLCEFAKRYKSFRPFIMPLAVSVILVLGVLAHRQTGFWKNTNTLFEHSIAVDKHNPIGYLKLAEIALDRHENKLALHYYKEDLKLNPHDLYSVVYLARFYAYTLQDPKKASALLLAELKRPDSNKPMLYGELGTLLLMYHNPNEAIKYLDSSLHYAPHISDTYVLRALAYKDLKNYKQAVRDLREAIKLNGQNMVAYKYLANLYLSLGMYDDAKKMFDIVLQLNPSALQGHKQLDNVINLLKQRAAKSKDSNK